MRVHYLTSIAAVNTALGLTGRDYEGAMSTGTSFSPTRYTMAR
jgi:hypothetical protein